MSASPEMILAGLGILLAVWYLFASIYNRRRGLTIYRWLQADLDALGGEVTGKWIGSAGSGAQLNVLSAKPPFKEVSLIYLLASRELLPLFLVDLLRGKNDRLIVRLTLRSNPGHEIEIARRLADRKDRQQIEKLPSGHEMSARGPRLDAAMPGVRALLDKYGALVQTLSWSKKPPHLILILSLAGLAEKAGSARSLFEDLTALAGSTGQ